MEVVVKARFNSSKERVENFGRNRYVMYLTFEEDEDSIIVIKSFLSRYMGVPEKSIELKNRNSVTGDFVFAVN
ncbi:MAG: hypothetical protein Q8Q31_03870 [Nanoarchaeota archaeon]|nr:hypothetical protein [Nanoarchaeota archaeon]